MRPRKKPSSSSNAVGKYRLGDRIGKGGFGEVFYAQNHETGDFVAVKRIPLRNMKKEQLNGVLEEINLLKMLDNPNIVRYIDTVKTSEYLHIVLEYVENGSLSDIVTRFGSFSETLCAVYISQVLKGLKYLHKQGVIHRDIKGANILTTKDGQVKLADFGIAVRKSDSGADDIDVCGTPYWMAPEIIQMTGLTTACDIWSVGCVVIELLQGQPPFFDLAPMRALYRIVQDPHPPLPPGISFACSDFLMLCFQKQPTIRSSAEDLLRHAWVTQQKKKNRGSMKKDSKKKMIDDDTKTEQNDDVDITENHAKEYLSRTTKVPDHIRKALTGTIRIYKKDITLAADGQKGDVTLSTEHNDSSKQEDVRDDDDDDAEDNDEEEEDWGDEFDVQVQEEKAEENGTIQTLVISDKKKSKHSKIVKGRVAQNLDEDDWGAEFEDDDVEFEDFTKQQDNDATVVVKNNKDIPMTTNVENDDDDWGGDYNNNNNHKNDDLFERMHSALERNEEVHLEAPSFNKDGVDLFDGLDFREDPERDIIAKQSQEIVLLLEKMTSSKEIKSRIDACVRLREIFEEVPHERNTFFVHHGAAPLMAILEQSQSPSSSSPEASNVVLAALRLVNTIVRDNQKLQEKLSMVGLIPVMCKYAGEKNRTQVRLEAAKFVRQLCSSSDFTLQMFIACGGLSILAGFVPSKYDDESRELAHVAIDGIHRAFALRRQTFATEFSRQLIKERFTVNLARLFVQILRQCLWRNKGQDGAAKIRDEALVYAERSSYILCDIAKCDRSVKEQVGTDDDFVAAFMQTLRLFLGDPADGKKRTKVVMSNLLHAFLQLSREPNNLDHFAAHGAVEAMVQLLAEVESREMYGILLQITFYLCRLSRPRTLAAAHAGLVPHLQQAVKNQRDARQFAVPLLCDMGYIPGTREELWRHHVVEFYIELLHDSVWRHLALASMTAWAVDDIKRIENVLLKAHNLESLILFAREVKAQDLIDKDILNPLVKLMGASNRLSQALGCSAFFVMRLLELLKCREARVRKSLLMMLRYTFKAIPAAKQLSFMLKHNLFPIIGRMADREAKKGIVIVARVANKLQADFNLCIEMSDLKESG